MYLCVIKNYHEQFMITYFKILFFVISMSDFNICRMISSKYFTQYWQKCPKNSETLNNEFGIPTKLTH